MTRLLLGTRNAHKAREIQEILGPEFELRDLMAYPEIPEIVESGKSFEENAKLKAIAVSKELPALVIADDSGLEVDALHGAPGVISARYAAPAGVSGNSSDEDNNAKLLRKTSNIPDARRTARFVCVISVAKDGQEVAQFRGEAEGILLREARGHDGFGYDPLFYFPELDKTFAELAPEEKAKVSHRGEATAYLRQYLRFGVSEPAAGRVTHPAVGRLRGPGSLTTRSAGRIPDAGVQ